MELSSWIMLLALAKWIHWTTYWTTWNALNNSANSFGISWISLRSGEQHDPPIWFLRFPTSIFLLWNIYKKNKNYAMKSPILFFCSFRDSSFQGHACPAALPFPRVSTSSHTRKDNPYKSIQSKHLFLQSFPLFWIYYINYKWAFICAAISIELQHYTWVFGRSLLFILVEMIDETLFRSDIYIGLY
jgi:hypothetical protein